MDEDEILHWLLSHLENEEIEDIDEDTLDRMIKEGRTMAVLFCKLIIAFPLVTRLHNFLSLQTTTTTRNPTLSSQSSRTLTMSAINSAFPS
jgi:hypothetical protein